MSDQSRCEEIRSTNVTKVSLGSHRQLTANIQNSLHANVQFIKKLEESNTNPSWGLVCRMASHRAPVLPRLERGEDSA